MGSLLQRLENKKLNRKSKNQLLWPSYHIVQQLRRDAARVKFKGLLQLARTIQNKEVTAFILLILRWFLQLEPFQIFGSEEPSSMEDHYPPKITGAAGRMSLWRIWWQFKSCLYGRLLVAWLFIRKLTLTICTSWLMRYCMASVTHQPLAH